LRILGLNAAKEKLEIVSGAAPPPFQIFAGGFFRKNAFGLIQEYRTSYIEHVNKRYRTLRVIGGNAMYS